MGTETQRQSSQPTSRLHRVTHRQGGRHCGVCSLHKGRQGGHLVTARPSRTHCSAGRIRIAGSALQRRLQRRSVTRHGGGGTRAGRRAVLAVDQKALTLSILSKSRRIVERVRVARYLFTVQRVPKVLYSARSFGRRETAAASTTCRRLQARHPLATAARSSRPGAALELRAGGCPATSRPAAWAATWRAVRRPRTLLPLRTQRRLLLASRCPCRAHYHDPTPGP